MAVKGRNQGSWVGGLVGGAGLGVSGSWISTRVLGVERMRERRPLRQWTSMSRVEDKGPAAKVRRG